jgi:hypothetical protein
LAWKTIIVAYSNYLLLLASGQGMLCLCTHRLWQDTGFLAPDTYENQGIYLHDIVLCCLDSLGMLYDDCWSNSQDPKELLKLLFFARQGNWQHKLRENARNLQRGESSLSS